MLRRRHPRQWLFNRLILLGLMAFSLTGLSAEKMDNATILLYHHVATDTPRSTSVTPDEFARHLDYLAQNHEVLPLSEVVQALQKQRPLPGNTVAITFDDGYANILQNAHPLLRKYEFPYTIFVNPKVIGKRADQLTWDDVKAMQKEGVTFANHTLDHLHMLERNTGESQTQWLDRIWSNVVEAEQQLAMHTGQSLRYLAYPYGEFNQALANHVKEKGYVGFAQHSGAVASYSDFSALPRFPAAGPYARLETLSTKLSSLAMPVLASSISDPQLEQRQLTQAITLTLDTTDVQLRQAACYYNGSAIKISTTDSQLSFNLEKALPVGRSRVNCTAPSQWYDGRYYWFSQPFFIADENGRFPD